MFNTIKRPMLFFSVPDCGCGGNSQTNGNATPINANPATICDNRYLSLIKVPRLALLGVVQGSNCQGYLDERPGGQPKRGFLTADGSGLGAFIDPRPLWDLPLINNVSNNQVGLPGGWPYMVVAGGSAPNTPWSFLQAPATGAYTLQTENGAFVLRDAGSIPGMNTVCSQQSAATSGNLLACAPTGANDANGAPTFTVRKLLALDKRAVVGVKNPDHTVSFRSLPDAEPFEHPSAKFDACRAKTYEQLTPEGNTIPGGLPLLPLTGESAVIDSVRAYYSPSTNKFYRSPEPWYKSTTNSAVANTANPVPVGWTPMPSGHGIAEEADINYPNVEISVFIDLSGDENLDFALFRGETAVKTFDYGMTRGHVAFSIIDTKVPPGKHIYNVRIKRGAGGNTNAATIRQSTIVVKTLG